MVLRVERERARAAKVNRDAARLQLQVHKHREDAGQTDEVLEVRDELAYIYIYIYMSNRTMTYLRMYCNIFPIVLNINHSFSNFEET